MRLNGPAGYFENVRTREIQVQPLKGIRDVLASAHDMEVFVGMPRGHLRLKLIGWPVPFQMPVILEITWAYICQIGVDVLGSLLPANTKAVHQMVSC